MACGLLVSYLFLTLNITPKLRTSQHHLSGKFTQMRNDKAYKDVVRCRKTQKTCILANAGRKTKRMNQRLLNWGARRAAFRPYSSSIFAFFPVFSRLFELCLAVFPYELTHQICRLFSIIMRLKSLVYYRCQLPRFIILNLCVNVHRYLAVFVTG